ncbi:MAG: transcription-repair coupling factor [Phototrophicaceae bacterium]
MRLHGLLDALRRTPAFHNLLEQLRRPSRPEGLALGLLRAARPYVLGALATDWHAPIVYISARPETAYNTAEQLPVWIDAVRVTRFAEGSSAFYERSAWGESAISGRIGALAALLNDTPNHPAPVVVASARALMGRTLPANVFRRETIHLKVGGRQDIGKLLAHLQGVGYEHASLVIEPGTFSRRGGIVDVYPVTMSVPVRIEFFDDEVDSLRTFDPTSQRSIAQQTAIMIPPAREALPQLTPPLGMHLAGWFNSLSASNPDDTTSPLQDALKLESGAGFAFLEHYLPYLYSNPISLLDYAPTDALIIVDDWDALRESVEALEDEAESTRAEKFALNDLPPDYPRPYLTWEELEQTLNQRGAVRLGQNAFVDVDIETAIGVGPMLFGGMFVPGERYGGMLKPMLRKAQLQNEADGRTVIVSEQAHRMAELWKETSGGVSGVTPTDLLDYPPATPQFMHGILQEGWTLLGDGGGLSLLSDAEVFGWRRTEPRRRQVAQRAKAGARVEYADWRDGDFIVHEDFGIGQFAGMQRRTIDDVEREYLLVKFAKNAQLFVPVHQADRLTRYVGPDERPPELTMLGSPEWGRTKSKARKNAEEEARELLHLYASRARTPGYAFNPDSPWQNELEASFPYIETDDQLRAVRDTKRDMEAPFPMDRLICGDAGYGKTEVAVRAAFKAVQDGKQVAVLVPTTVLAQQHYETFGERMLGFPVRVEQISRFRTNEEQNRIVDRIASGEVDIVVGTHRLLSSDIRFNDLGLVVIDEEQRFGVKQKEHLKKIRTQVDVLTLTATPIPRTLHMALVGVRDISMIQTPPEERLPVITHVGPFDRRLVRAAIMRELERGGQIFFVHNRVRTIDSIEEQLAEIVPEARVVVAHGQMDGHTLGAIMRSFGRGEFDVLLATSIIESGIDIPNANTLIIDRADWFGLAQLYQIRGRVGRSAQQAYAYILHPPHNRLTHEARSRLETLSENTQLGAGFQIALRDLEIRGAGDILSSQQSGHLASVGLFLYTQMLAQAVEQLKTTSEFKLPEPRDEISPIMIDLPTPAYIPTDWIPEMALRLQLYRRVAGLETLESVQTMRDELADRFGGLPPAVLGLMYQIEVKILGLAAGATAIQHRQEKVYIKLPYLPNVNRSALAESLRGLAEREINVTRTAVEMPLYLTDMGSWQQTLLQVLGHLSAAVQVGTS